MTTSASVQSRRETEIRQLIAEREAAMHARDAARIVASYAPEIVKFDLSPPLLHAGPSELDPRGMQAWMDGFDGDLEYAVRDFQVTANDELAFCHSLNHLSASPRGANFRFSLWFRATLCLQRRDGAWRITHEHNSTPFYMDGSLRAAVDLEP